MRCARDLVCVQLILVVIIIISWSRVSKQNERTLGVAFVAPRRQKKNGLQIAVRYVRKSMFVHDEVHLARHTISKYMDERSAVSRVGRYWY